MQLSFSFNATFSTDKLDKRVKVTTNDLKMSYLQGKQTFEENSVFFSVNIFANVYTLLC